MKKKTVKLAPVSTISELLHFFELIPMFLKCLPDICFLSCSNYWGLQMAPNLSCAEFDS